MIEAVKAGKGKIENVKQASKEIQVLDQTDDMATVKVTSNDFVDYLHLAKFNTQWKIINALWDYKSSPGSGTADEAKKILNDYVSGWSTGHAEVMNKVLLHAFVGRMALSLTEVENTDFNWMVKDMGNCPERSIITKAKVKDIKILDISNNLASAKISYDGFVEYVHFSYVDNQWFIVNSLRNFRLNPQPTAGR